MRCMQNHREHERSQSTKRVGALGSTHRVALFAPVFGIESFIDGYHAVDVFAAADILLTTTGIGVSAVCTPANLLGEFKGGSNLRAVRDDFFGWSFVVLNVCVRVALESGRRAQKQEEGCETEARFHR